TIIANDQGGFDVIAGHTYARAATDLSWIVQIVKKTDGAQLSNKALIDVADLPIGVAPGIDVLTTEGNPSSGFIAAITDANLQSPAADFTVTVDWGDQSASPATVLADGPGKFDVFAGHTYAEEGEYTVTIHVADSGGSTAQTQVHAHVSDAPLIPSAGA